MCCRSGQSHNPSLATVNGIQVIGYEDFSIFGLRVAHTTDSQAQDFQNNYLIYNGLAASPRRSTSVAEVNGHACIAFPNNQDGFYDFGILY